MTFIRIDKKFPLPTPFPKGCKAYLQFFNIEEHNYPYWLYQNAKGEDLFVVVRQDFIKNGEKKKIKPSKINVAIIGADGYLGSYIVSYL